MGKLIYLKNVVTLDLNEQKCTGCGMCLEVCPHQVFQMDGRKARIQDRDACMECGACRRNCPSGALFVESGVGCAAAVLSTLLGKQGDCCCGPGAGDAPGGCCG
jgi:NAD-dependent dihydropyrimidine dehydrogenase PreA subunit